MDLDSGLMDKKSDIFCDTLPALPENSRRKKMKRVRYYGSLQNLSLNFFLVNVAFFLMYLASLSIIQKINFTRWMSYIYLRQLLETVGSRLMFEQFTNFIKPAPIEETIVVTKNNEEGKVHIDIKLTITVFVFICVLIESVRELITISSLLSQLKSFHDVKRSEPLLRFEQPASESEDSMYTTRLKPNSGTAELEKVQNQVNLLSESVKDITEDTRQLKRTIHQRIIPSYPIFQPQSFSAFSMNSTSPHLSPSLWYSSASPATRTTARPIRNDSLQKQHSALRSDSNDSPELRFDLSDPKGIEAWQKYVRAGEKDRRTNKKRVSLYVSSKPQNNDNANSMFSATPSEGYVWGNRVDSTGSCMKGSSSSLTGSVSVRLYGTNDENLIGRRGTRLKLDTKDDLNYTRDVDQTANTPTPSESKDRSELTEQTGRFGNQSQSPLKIPLKPANGIIKNADQNVQQSETVTRFDKSGKPHRRVFVPGRGWMAGKKYDEEIAAGNLTSKSLESFSDRATA